MSAREEIARRIGAVVEELGLTSPFFNISKTEARLDKLEGGRRQASYWGVLFSSPRTLDGLIRVYGPTFILMETNQTGREKFTSEAECIAAIWEHWGTPNV